MLGVKPPRMGIINANIMQRFRLKQVVAVG
jgi:hypothetical protein